MHRTTCDLHVFILHNTGFMQGIQMPSSVKYNIAIIHPKYTYFVE